MDLDSDSDAIPEDLIEKANNISLNLLPVSTQQRTINLNNGEKIKKLLLLMKKSY